MKLSGVLWLSSLGVLSRLTPSQLNAAWARVAQLGWYWSQRQLQL